MPNPSNAAAIARIKVIRDNIHGYIALTEIERGFLIQPEFHRLHFISQNGLAFDTFPATKHTRFLHSLGAMHLAGRILISGMRKDTPGARSLRKALGGYLQNNDRFLLSEARKIITRDHLYSDLGIADDELLCVMFQAVRLASLIHDIGHPPFSHTVEEALQMLVLADPAGASVEGARSLRLETYPDLVSSINRLPGRQGGLHERIGEHLVYEVMIPRLAGDLQMVGSRLVEFAINISAHSEMHPALTALKGIVDGEFDCDRADYVLRDCEAAGVDFGGYDLDRIIPEIAVLEVQGDWFFRPTTRAISAIESFYEERSRLYRWIVFHHSCVRSHIALQRATIACIRLYERSDSFLSEELGKLHKFVEPIKRLWSFGEYRVCDESWYFSFLATLLGEVSSYLEDCDKVGRNVSAALQDLHGYGQQARWRTKNMYPLWKGIDQYREFCSGVLVGPQESMGEVPEHGDANSIVQANAWLHMRLDRPLRDRGILVFEWLEDKLAKRFNSRVALHLTNFKYVGPEKATREGLEGLGVYLIDEQQGAGAKTRLLPLSEVSPVPASLKTVWENSIHFRAYVLDWGEMPVSPVPPRLFGTALAEILASQDFTDLWHTVHHTSPSASNQQEKPR